MGTQLAREFHAEVKRLQAILLGLDPEQADTPWRSGGWTRKQIVGHLLDSAANNRQRFVRAAADGRYAGPKYEQELWVAAHGYGEQDWETLLRWWQGRARDIGSGGGPNSGRTAGSGMCGGRRWGSHTAFFN